MKVKYTTAYFLRQHSESAVVCTIDTFNFCRSTEIDWMITQKHFRERNREGGGWDEG